MHDFVSKERCKKSITIRHGYFSVFIIRDSKIIEYNNHQLKITIVILWKRAFLSNFYKKII